MRLDRRLNGLAHKMGFVYSRYADDLAFSWHHVTKAHIGVLLKQGKKIIQEEGFQPHPEKTRVLRENQRQKLCADSGFEPYAAFSRIDRRNHGLVTARDLLDFLQSVDMMGSLCESDCQVLVKYYDTQRDGQSLDYSR